MTGVCRAACALHALNKQQYTPLCKRNADREYALYLAFLWGTDSGGQTPKQRDLILDNAVNTLAKNVLALEGLSREQQNVLRLSRWFKEATPLAVAGLDRVAADTAPGPDYLALTTYKEMLLPRPKETAYRTALAELRAICTLLCEKKARRARARLAVWKMTVHKKNALLPKLPPIHRGNAQKIAALIQKTTFPEKEHPLTHCKEKTLEKTSPLVRKGLLRAMLLVHQRDLSAAREELTFLSEKCKEPIAIRIKERSSALSALLETLYKGDPWKESLADTLAKAERCFAQFVESPLPETVFESQKRQVRQRMAQLAHRMAALAKQVHSFALFDKVELPAPFVKLVRTAELHLADFIHGAGRPLMNVPEVAALYKKWQSACLVFSRAISEMPHKGRPVRRLSQLRLHA